jgi:hypothetical protein
LNHYSQILGAFLSAKIYRYATDFDADNDSREGSTGSAAACGCGEKAICITIPGGG